MTPTANIRLMTLYNNHHHHTAASVANTSRARVQFGMRPFARVYVGPFHVSSQRWGHWHWQDNKDGEFIKVGPHTKRLRKQLHFNASMRYLDRCDVPLVPEDFAFPSSWTNWPYPNRKWLQLTALLTMRGDCLLKIERRLKSTTDLHSQGQRPKTKASFRPSVDYTPFYPNRAYSTHLSWPTRVP